MANERSPYMEDDGDDDFFREVYGKEYTGPPRLARGDSQDKQRDSKRPPPGEESDGDDGAPDPNAVPTDFTSREAKVWEAKAKAVERNWKKRKEEEMICKLCGESGHFTQGCPSTLGGGKKSAEFFERIAARDKRVRALFTEAAIRGLEKDIGCKIRMDEKFIFVSGKDRLVLAKGVDAVHKLIQGEGEDKSRSQSPSQKSRSGSPEREARSSHSSRRDSPHVHQRKGFSHEEGSRKQSWDSPKAHGKNGLSRRPGAGSKSPAGGQAFNPYDVSSRDPPAARRPERWAAEKPAAAPDFPLEELEAEFGRQSKEIQALRDKEEDEENRRHRERLRELRESYGKKVEAVRARHAKQWEELLRADAQRRVQAYREAQQMHAYAAYAEAGLRVGGGPAADAWGGMYAAMSPHEGYGELQHGRWEDLGRAGGYGGGRRY